MAAAGELAEDLVAIARIREKDDGGEVTVRVPGHSQDYQVRSLDRAGHTVEDDVIVLLQSDGQVKTILGGSPYRTSTLTPVEMDL